MSPKISASAGTDSDVNWTILVAFHGLDARQRALRVCDHMVARFWPEMEFQVHWCSFDQLASTRFADTAAHHAANANIVIIATGNDARLPEGVKDWMSSWCRERHGREGTLIALVEGGMENPSANQTHEHLRSAAHHAGLDYLTDEPAFAPMPLPDESAWVNAKAAELGPVLDGILNRSIRPQS